MTSQVSGSPFSYLIVFAFPAIDAIVPIAPGESVIVSASVLAANGQMWLIPILVAGFAGALIGDNVMYAFGSKAGRPLANKVFRGEKAQRRLEWAERALDEHGGRLVVIARFLPGGRTATTFGAGMLQMRWRKFIAADAVGAALWTALFATIGYLGGRTFQDSPWQGLALSFGIAAAIGVGTELARRLRRRRRGANEAA
jgi:membrane protein DedA with SNARE-associated domain